jgi:hypothetical protein
MVHLESDTNGRRNYAVRKGHRFNLEVRVMIEVKKFVMPDVVPQDELKEWRRRIKKVEAEHCPGEVRDFITAVANKLPDFGQIGQFNTHITGYELQLSGMKEFNGEAINPWEIYTMPVPRMVAVDHETAMHRIFCRHGKQGLINYCRARVKGSELEKLMEILNVHVFHQSRPEFLKVMSEINKAQKIDTQE